MLLVKLDFLTATLFSVSFALPMCLTLELGTLGGACLELALLLTIGEVLRVFPCLHYYAYEETCVYCPWLQHNKNPDTFVQNNTFIPKGGKHCHMIMIIILESLSGDKYQNHCSVSPDDTLYLHLEKR